MPTVNPLSPSTSPLFPSSPLGGSGIVSNEGSSVSEAVNSDYGIRGSLPSERPQLTLPRDLPSSELRLLSVTESTRTNGDELLEIFGHRLGTIKQKIAEVSAEMMEKLNNALERAKNSDVWSILKKIATCLISAISLVFGIALVASGGGALIGGAMITSGILSLANFALSENKGWEWVADQICKGNDERKQKLIHALPIAVGLLAGGIGLVGSVASIATGAVQFAAKAMFVAQTALSLFDATTTMGKGIADAQLLWSQGDVAVIKAHLTAAQESFTTVFDEIRSFMSETNGVKTKTKKAISMITESNNQLVRQV